MTSSSCRPVANVGNDAICVALFDLQLAPSSLLPRLTRRRLTYTFTCNVGYMLADVDEANVDEELRCHKDLGVNLCYRFC